MEEPEQILQGEREEEEEEEDYGVTEKVNEFFTELDIEQEQRRRRLRSEGVRAPRRRSVLPSHLHSVMGSANLTLARGDTSGAIELCMEVIRQAPHVIEPFLTLATIYEDLGKKEKLLQILLICAYLKQNDINVWCKAAELAIELTQLHIGEQCFKKAYALDKSNYSLLWRRASILQEMGQFKNAIDCYTTLRECLPDGSGPDFIEVTKELSRIYHQQLDDVKAIDLLQDSFDKYSDHFDDEAVNILSELLISSRQFENAFELLTNYYKLSKGATTTLAPPPPTSTANTSTTGNTGTSTTGNTGTTANTGTSTTGNTGTTGNVSTTEPFSISTALSLSMGASDELGQSISELTGLTGLTGEESTQPKVIIDEIPENVPVDIRAKLVVCMIQLKHILPQNTLLVLTSFPESYGDLILDVAEAFMENAEYSKALPLLTTLTETKEFSQAGVWLKHAECLHMLNELEPAALSYSKVLSLAPHHTETRMILASLYSQLGMTEDALALLDAEDNLYSSQDDDEETVLPMEPPVPQKSPTLASKSKSGRRGTSSLKKSVTFAESSELAPALSQDVRLLLTKFMLLVGEDRVKEYVDVGVEMLLFFFRQYYDIKDIREYIGLSDKSIRMKLRKFFSEEDKSLKEQEKFINVDEWWKVFYMTCKGLYKLGQYDSLIHLLFCADVSKKLEAHRKELLLLASSASLLTADDSLFHFMRLLYFKKSDFPLFWNLFNCMSPLQRQHKFILRQLIKNPSQMPLVRLSANYSLLSSSYKFALAQYELAYREDPNDHLLCLCIAVVYLQMVLQKHTLKKNTLVLQAVGFLHKYFNIRGPCQEAYYNVGRFFHQLGLLHIACRYYKMVLSTDPDNLRHDSNAKKVYPSLTHEAAFNLGLIYNQSGNRPLALHYMWHYCRI